MPNVLLPAPHFRQSRDGFCLPACVRMVLAYWGEVRHEADIAQQLGTKRHGTPISAVRRLAQDRRYDVELAVLSDSTLKSLLQNGIPVIVRVWTAMLPNWTVETSHVVVIVGYDDTGVFVNDPGAAAHSLHVAWDAFLAAWAEFDETAVILTPSRT